MMKKVFKPFWSFDVQETEKWLSSMAANGYHVIEFHRYTHRFVFEEGDPKKVIYQIGFDKNQTNVVSSALENEGWVKVSRSKHWYILVNKQHQDEINVSPHREGVIKHNRKVMYIIGAVSAYILFSFFIFLTVFVVMIFSSDPWNVEGSPLWSLTFLFWFIGFLILFQTIKLYRSNERLSRGIEELKDDSIEFSRREEKRLKDLGEIIVKRKFAWWYSPDKLEEWLEKKESEGYNLHRMSKIGNKFYFRKGPTRKVRYCIDYQNTVQGSYFDMHQETGWKLVYTSKSSWMKWTIWSLEYQKESQRPEMYTDKTNHLKQARRITFINVGGMLPLVFVVSMLFSSSTPFTMGGALTTSIFFIVFGLAILLNLYQALKSMMYYSRVKKSLGS